MKGLRKTVARFLGVYGHLMPETAEGVETALSVVLCRIEKEGVREGLERARQSIPTDAVA